MNPSLIKGMAVFLMIAGALISILFWIPGLVNRQSLKEILGKRYPVIYFVYLANGPVLFLFGLALFFTLGRG